MVRVLPNEKSFGDDLSKNVHEDGVAWGLWFAKGFEKKTVSFATRSSGLRAAVTGWLWSCDSDDADDTTDVGGDNVLGAARLWAVSSLSEEFLEAVMGWLMLIALSVSEIAGWPSRVGERSSNPRAAPILSSKRSVSADGSA